MARVKRSSPDMSSLASKVLKGYQPTPEEVRSLAASVLSQDTTKGQGKPRQPDPVDQVEV